MDSRPPLPGPVSTRWIDTLAQTECPAFTTRRARRAEQSGAPWDPIVWTSAHGSEVRDADGHIFTDLTAGFGAAAVGHTHPRVVSAVQDQANRLLHALGDVHPSDTKIKLLERLATLAPWPNARVVLGLSGSDAVEVALKTAALATGRPGVLAFEGAYHGLSYGALATCGYSARFRDPFQHQLNPHVTIAPWPAFDASPSDIEALLKRAWNPKIGAVIVEPILGRGGVRVPPPGFLSSLRAFARQRDAVFIVDEVLTGLYRCGALFQSTQEVTPDLICLGKALGAGVPISACIGNASVMSAWGDSGGEAIHTGTFFGYPLGCAAALASLDVLQEEKLAERARSLGEWLKSELEKIVPCAPTRDRLVRGTGMMIGVETGRHTLTLVQTLMARGFLTLPAGDSASVVQITPPLTIEQSRLEEFLATFAGAFKEICG